MASPAPSPDLLLERVRCVRALARAIASETASGEDIARDTLLQALERGPESDEPLPHWLARTVRSLAQRARRAAGRRTRRERAAARPEALPPTSELVERAWLQRTLVESVVALDEPYRSIVLLRYFEDLPPREIARLRGASVRTVQTQLGRGLSHDFSPSKAGRFRSVEPGAEGVVIRLEPKQSLKTWRVRFPEGCLRSNSRPGSSLRPSRAPSRSCRSAVRLRACAARGQSRPNAASSNGVPWFRMRSRR